ncbi:hypothetical protein ACRAWD_10560 [Caulobacter segnis]
MRKFDAHVHVNVEDPRLPRSSARRQFRASLDQRRLSGLPLPGRSGQRRPPFHEA